MKLTPEEINECYAKAEERWEKDGKSDIYEFNFLWQYITDEVIKAQLQKLQSDEVVEKVALNLFAIDSGARIWDGDISWKNLSVSVHQNYLNKAIEIISLLVGG